MTTSGHEVIGREVLDDLASRGALAGDDQRIVVGRHQGRAALLRNVARDRLAVVARPVVQHDLGAEGLGALALRPRRIAAASRSRPRIDRSFAAAATPCA